MALGCADLASTHGEGTGERAAAAEKGERQSYSLEAEGRQKQGELALRYGLWIAMVVARGIAQIAGGAGGSAAGGGELGAAAAAVADFRREAAALLIQWQETCGKAHSLMFVVRASQ